MVKYDPDSDRILYEFIDYDKKDAFVRRIRSEAQSVGGYDVYQSLMLSHIVRWIIVESSDNCAAALLEGHTGLKLDINAVIPDVGVAPLHLSSDDPELVDLFLRYGARTDIRCMGRLPLDCAIENISDRFEFFSRFTPTSIYKTIVFLCELQLEREFECVRLLFRATKEVEKEIYRYAKDGKLIEIAALLMVAPKEVTSPTLFKGFCDPALNGSMSLRQLVLSEIVSLMASQITLVSTSEEVHDELNNKLETMISMLHLIEVFERIGDKIELYRRYLSKRYQETLLAAHIACLLIGEGFSEYKDLELKRDDVRDSSVSIVSGVNYYISEILGWRLYEGIQLESGTANIYKQHEVVANIRKEMIPRLSNQPQTLEAIPILRESLEKLCYHPYLNDWTPKKSIFKLICILCLPELKESLESIRMVACKTEWIETIGCDLARHGKLIELASLLMVAPEKLTSPGSNDLRSNAIHRCITSDLQAMLDAEVRLIGRSNCHEIVEKCKDEKEMKLATLLLLESFERSGGSINRYLQSDAYNDGTGSRLETAREIQHLLEKEGFALKHKDTDLNDIKCFSPTLDPVDYTSLPSPLRPRHFSVAEVITTGPTQRPNPQQIHSPTTKEYYRGYDCIIRNFIEYDIKHAFVRWIHYQAQSVGGYDVYRSLMLSDIVNTITSESAVKCATALLQGETGLKLDINAADPFIYSGKLHYSSNGPEMIDLLLRCGAETDYRRRGVLPLDSVLGDISKQPPFIGWSKRQSLYMTLVFCQCETKILECARLLFKATKEVEKEIYRYVKDGKLIEIAALLTVAREEVTSPSLFKGLCDSSLNGSMSLRQLVLSEIASLMASQIALVSTSEKVHDERNNKLETMMSMLRLIEVSERVGDKTELYRRYLTKLNKEELAAHMACLLIKEGFAEYKDFELKRPVSCERVTQFHKEFLELLGTTKIYKQHDEDTMPRIPRLSSRPPTLEAIPILSNEDDAKGSFPLRISLEKLCYHPYLNDWTPEKSIFKLVCILCLPQLKESLERIRLDACKIEIETIGCNLARQGRLVELAALLMVAPDKLIVAKSPGTNDLSSSVIHRCIMSDLQASIDAEVRLMGRSNRRKLVEKCKDEKEMKLSALLLLEVFERAADSINRYLQSDTYKDGTRSRLEIVREIQNLLEKAGFSMKHKDTDLNDIKRFSPTLDPIDQTSLPLASRPHEFSVAEKKHVFDTQRGLPRTPSVQGSVGGSRPFHTMVHGNSNCGGPRVSTPKSKALKPRMQNISGKSIGWFVSLGVDITKVMKRV